VMVQRCARFYCPDEPFRRYSLLPVWLQVIDYDHIARWSDI